MALSAVCLGLLGVTVWALATRGDGASSSNSAEGSVFWVATEGDDAEAGTPGRTVGHAPARGRQRRSGRHGAGARGCVRAAARDRRLGTPRTADHVRGGPRRTGRARWLVARGSRRPGRRDRDRLPAVRPIQGFEITGYRSDVSGHVPVGILVTGASDHIRIAGNLVHDMGTTFEGRSGGDAHGIAVFGTSGDHPIEEVEIVGQRAGEPHPRFVRGAGRERQREGLPHRGQPGPRHEQHRDRRDRLRGHRAGSDRRPGARRDRARQQGVERRQLRQPRLRQRPERRRHLRGRRPRHPDRGQHDPRREHRDRARQRACRTLHPERHRAQQPGLRLDGDRDRDRRLRSAPGEHRGMRHRQQHGREHRWRRAVGAVRHARTT